MSYAFSGIRVIESLLLTEDGDPVTVTRTWRERLFTRPWQPLVATRTIVPKIPYRGWVQLNPTTVVMHPQTIRVMREQLPQRASGEK